MDAISIFQTDEAEIIIPEILVSYCLSISPNGNLTDRRTKAYRALLKYAISSEKDQEVIIKRLQLREGFEQAILFGRLPE